MVLFQKYEEAIFEIFHLISLIFVEVNPNLHPVEGLPDVVRFCRYEPNPIYSVTPVKILTYEVKHQCLVYLLIILLDSLHLKDESSPVGVGLIFPRGHDISFEKVNGIDDLQLFIDLVSRIERGLLIALESLGGVEDEKVVELREKRCVPDVGQILEGGESVDLIQMVRIFIEFLLLFGKVREPDLPGVDEGVFLHYFIIMLKCSKINKYQYFTLYLKPPNLLTPSYTNSNTIYPYPYYFFYLNLQCC